MIMIRKGGLFMAKKSVSVPEIPTRGICPLASFNKESVTENEDGRQVVDDSDFPQSGICHVPALYLAEGTHPSDTVFVDCAAIDLRSSYLNCQIFLKWFWFTAASKKQLKKPKETSGEPETRRSAFFSGQE
jgi:hypothetical protein